MASVNIAIKQEAYEFLKSMKGRDKSFSDVVLGFKPQKTDIRRFFGVLKDKDWKKAEESMESLRESFRKRLR